MILFEDDDLLVVNKAAGWNTHAPSPYAGEGIYEWLKHREPRWAQLAIIHRLDKETSGILVFGKTTSANRSLTQQFAEREVSKTYIMVTDRPISFEQLKVESSILRSGERYVSRPLHAGADRAETHFKVIAREGERTVIEAEPVTGRTHQIRVHAAGNGFPILGDTLYGGTAASRVYLHAAEIRFAHPVSGAPAVFTAKPDWQQDERAGVENGPGTDSWRAVHGGSDGFPGWYVEKYGDWLLSHGESALSAPQTSELERLARLYRVRGAYHKILTRHVRGSGTSASPQPVFGDEAPERFAIAENGCQFEVSFREGYSVGIFLDQRDNRRRLITQYVGAGFPLFEAGVTKPEVLNAFAYTCAFSVAAAKGGARTTSLDLSRKYLDWGRRNFELNNLDPAGHDFIYGDAFDWLRRLAKKGRTYDVVILDPPTFSQSKESGVWQAERDYGRLVDAALPMVKRRGVLLASTNAARLEPEKFIAIIREHVARGRRTVMKEHYVPQPPDFPITRAEPAYLKTAWLRLD